MLLLIPFICALIYYSYYAKKNRSFGVINLLFLVYVYSLGLGALAYTLGVRNGAFDIRIPPMLYLSVILLLMFRGFSPFKDRTLRQVKLENVVLVRWLEIFILLGGIFSLIFFTPFAIIAMVGDINLNRINNSELIGAFGAFGLVNSFAGLFANSFVLAQTFFYLRLVDDTPKKVGLLKYLLLISSLSYVVYNLAYVGRDGVVLWIMTLVFQYLFFKDFLNPKKAKKLKRIAVIVIALISVPFAVITVARFGGRDEGVLWYIANYFYQQAENFNDQYIVNVPLQYGWFNFFDFVSFLDFFGLSYDSPMSAEVFTDYFRDKGVDPWKFAFWFGMILSDFGKFGTMLFLVIFTAISRKVLKRVRRTGIFIFSDYLLFVMLYQFAYYGLFYNRYLHTNSYLIFMLFLYGIMKLLRHGRALSYNKKK